MSCPAEAPETGDDHGGDAGSAPAPAPAPPVTQTFTSDRGAITVTLADSVLSPSSSTPAAGFAPEVHDNGPDRVEVRFFAGGTEWRIRVDAVNGQLVPEITQH